jgi:hypothetical protein
MELFFVVVNVTTKLAESYPDTSGLITEAQIIQWIDDMINGGGMGPNQELVASHEPFARPNVEERYITITQVDTYNNTQHPVYANIKQWQRTYTQTDVPLAEKLVAVDTKESISNETTIPYWIQLKVTTLAVYALMEFLNIDANAKIDATSISTKAKKNLRVLLKAAKKVKDNDTNKAAKKALLNANPLSNPDLETGWTLNDFTEEA